MYAYRIPNNRQKSVRENGHKNKSRSIITYKNSKINSKQNNNYINQMKKEILGKPRQEEQNLYNKKANRKTKQKSIDESKYNKNNKNIINNSSIINNNNYQKNILKQPKKNNKENTNNAFILKESNKNSFNKINNINNLNLITSNLKNTNYQKNQNLTTNSNYSLFSFSNAINEPSTTNEKCEESRDNFYDNDNIKLSNGKIVTTFVQIDDLTPIPDRIGAKQHYLAEYDYDEAKRAAVTCRRIEYSYNLRNVIKSEICLDEIITIQRWWRKILRKRNNELLKELKMQEKIKINNIQSYILFLNKQHYIYTMYLVKKFMNRLKIKYGKLFYKNLFNRNAAKIQNAYRSFVSRKKKEFQNLLKNLAYKKKKIKLFYNLDVFILNMNRIIKLQNFIKYYLLKKKESYYLKMANDIHPFMYYYLKYGIGNNDKSINIIKNKINGFIGMTKKWKNFVRSKKLLKALLFMENIKFILRKKYFIYFILRIVERINSMITYFLLKPLMKDILYIYYRKKLENIILRWKIYVKKIKRRDILALNIILKLVSKFAFKPFIKKLKKKNNKHEEIEEL